VSAEASELVSISRAERDALKAELKRLRREGRRRHGAHSSRPGPGDDTPAFTRDDPLPGACELHLPADDVTIWYTVRDMHR
jgi:hypothetical protein